ncbi:MAG: LOG family protein [Rubrivivax sp.]|nr:LOG family protein [Rubrivivax sp.]
MEAGNRGAHDVGGESIGWNNVLPHEQAPNPHITPGAVLPVPLLRAAQDGLSGMAQHRCVRFPGGFGTLDELSETLALVQTFFESRRRPILLFGKDSGAS